MASEPREAAKYDVFFIASENFSEKTTKVLESAFEVMQTSQLKPVWISVEDCLKIFRKESSTFFVTDTFNGEAFEHLRTLKCRIVGPLCILYCFQYHDALPIRPYPVYSVSMRKTTICCSNVEKQNRDEIAVKVQLMGGIFSRHLTTSVTHMVVGKVGSEKYKLASRTGVLIRTPEWIEDLWENGQHKLLHASESYYDKYKCPVFKGLTISVSELSEEEKYALKIIIEENGGSYSEALVDDQMTHLVLPESFFGRNRFAKISNVAYVNVKWIFDSVKVGYCQDEAIYAPDDSS